MKYKELKFEREQYDAELVLQQLNENTYLLNITYQKTADSAGKNFAFTLTNAPNKNVTFASTEVFNGTGAAASIDDAINQCAAAGFAKASYRVPLDPYDSRVIIPEELNTGERSQPAVVQLKKGRGTKKSAGSDQQKGL